MSCDCAEVEVGQDLMWIHVPQLTFKIGTGITPDLSRPLPIQVDKNGRFGYVVPGGVTHVFVKMYGTLWRKVIFDGGTTDTDQEKSWNGHAVNWTAPLELRYGDVNEDNLISVHPTTGDRAYLNERIGGSLDVRVPASDAIFKYDYVCDLNRDNKVDVVGDHDFHRDFLEPVNDLAGVDIP